MLYVVCRVPCQHQGNLQQLLGVASTEAAAVAMCSTPCDAVFRLEDGKLYPPGQAIAGGVPTIMPLFPNHGAGWTTSNCLTGCG